MSTFETTAVAEPASHWRRMRVWAAAHAVDDFYQGLVPAAVPYFVLQRDIGYLGASGLALAATLGSALPQIAVGVLADRRRLPWMSPLGISLAGIGAGVAGLVPAYPLMFVSLLVSGLGVAMFHPPAGRDARRAAGGSATAMSYFAAGGSVGFFVAPALATPALDALGVGATALFVPPAVLMGFVLLRHQRRTLPATSASVRRPGVDRPRLFATLTAVEVVRSTVSFGVNTFIALYWIRDLGATSLLGGVALTLQLAGGVLGTLGGGRIADRIGMVRTVRLGNALLVPALVAMLLCDNEFAALPLALLVGLVTNIPFAVLVKLGQDYLPTRPGTAAGVTLGLAVSAGGLVLPLLGLVADAHGPRGVLVVLAVVPVVAVVLSAFLREPGPR
ncbi:major facilitator superfamily MFS_1 [Pseudonocardia dioxanivorans CB1190]|uniref:Major facilitator superfamily MFS_1 n=1 Tax=Pseudonocardia dioxanivorans (strain ATCC 55486 / DSM 44775 / JCM 13855 / CB1190) TaxID=675635 RepID=F4CU77_PSEUX|nr:MFS transporter [Pseudonocardia dioxanivorans]AEA24155.1 major facilitator superfamily MFS_1 [Pseudonocardia dioxanivorans CB1190]